MDVDAAAVFHDGANEAAFGADQGVVQLGWDGDLSLLNVGLEGRTEFLILRNIKEESGNILTKIFQQQKTKFTVFAQHKS